MSNSDSSIDESVTLTILRTSDASKAEIIFSLNKSLNDLKSVIATSSLGPIDASYQRIFHLGRELKSNGRSLSKLGLGRFHNFCLHLHSTQPETCDLLSSDDDEEEVEIVPMPQKRAANNATVVDLIDSDDEHEGKRQRVS